MDRPGTLLYLAASDVAALDLDLGAVRAAVERAFALSGQGRLLSEPKTSILLKPGHAFQSLAAVDTDRRLAALKWIGMVPPGGAAAHTINATLLLSDTETGQLLCIMDARRATALRTAAMTAVAARHLAREDSVSIGFVGAGVQAESHLLALADALPSLRTVSVNSRTASTAERFAAMCRGRGFEAAAVSARQAVADSDVVVSSVPVSRDFEPFIDPAWVRPGAFVAAVDLGRSWTHEGLSGFDLTAVDEATMKTYAKPGNLVPSLAHAEATLADLAGGRHPGRTDDRQRTILFGSGSPVADLAMAAVLYERARASGVGMRLPLD